MDFLLAQMMNMRMIKSDDWSKVGAVGGDDWQWEVFYTEGKGIDPESENAKEWREYIFSKI